MKIFFLLIYIFLQLFKKKLWFFGNWSKLLILAHISSDFKTFFFLNFFYLMVT